MRKFSKILAVALTLCLLCSAIAISVFAAADTANKAMLNVTTYDDLNKADDFTNGKSDLVNIGGMNAAYVPSVITGVDNPYIQIKNKTTTTASGAFFGLTTVLQSRNNKPAEKPYFINKSSGSTSDLYAMVIDLDFGADQYSGEVSGTTTLFETEEAAIAAGAENIRPALDLLEALSMNVNLGLSTGTGAGGSTANAGAVDFEKKADGWYAIASKTVNNGRTYTNVNVDGIKLSNKVGALDHYTFVMYAASDVNSMVTDIYVNGELLLTSTYKIHKSGYKYIYVEQVRCTTLAETGHAYSFGMDNLAVNYYAAGYTTESTAIGIDDLIADTTNTIKLVECTDVVYNNDYIQHGCGSFTIEGYAPCHNPAYVTEYCEKNMLNGSFIEISGMNVNNFIPKNGITNFTINLKNGASFNLDDSVQNLVGSSQSGNIVYRPASANDKVTIEWLGADGVTVAKSETLLIGETPNTETAPAVGSMDYVTGKIKSVSAWTWNPLGDGDEALSALTDLMIMYAELENEENPTIQIKPSLADAGKAVFGIFDGEKSFIPAEFAWSDFTSLANIAAAVKDVNTSGLTFKLYDDDTDKKVWIPETLRNLASISNTGYEFNLDLNGLTVFNYYHKSSYGEQWISVAADDVTVNIFNGTAYQVINNSTSASADKIFGANGLVNIANTVKTAEVNLGKDGAPVNFYGGTVVYAAGTKDLATGTGMNITVNVKGGTYLNAARCANSMFAVQTPNVTINVDGAQLIYVNVNNAYGLFGGYNNYDASNMKVNCTDSTIVAIQDSVDLEPAPIFSKYCQSTYTATFEGCTIYGTYRPTGEISKYVTVKLGANNLVAGSFADAFTDSANAYHTFVDGTAILSSNEFFQNSVSLTYPTNFAANFTDASFDLSDMNNAIFDLNTVTLTFTAAYYTYSEQAGLPSNVVDIVYSGTSASETYKWLAGSEIVGGPDLVVEALNNGWYDIAATRWAQADNSTTVKAEGSVLTASETKPVAHVTGVKLNMSLWSHFGVNLFIPVPTIDTVTWNAFYEVNASTGAYTEITKNITKRTIDGKEYNMNIWYPTVENFNSVTRYADSTVNYEGQDYTLNQEFTYSILDYSERVINSYKCNTDDVRIIYAMIKYKETVTSFMTSGKIPAETQTLINEFYQKFDAMAHEDNCTCRVDITKPSFSEEEMAINSSSYAGLKDVVYGVSYTFASKPTLSIYVKDGITIDSITVTNNSAINGENAKYGSLDKISDYDFKIDDTTTAPAKRYNYVSMPACDIKNVITITVVSGGETYTGQYCLAEYIDNSTNESATAAAQSFWAYSNAAYNFRVITEEEAK